VFFLWGSGGVGLSLTTTLLQAQLGAGIHRIFDPQVFYGDQEMLRQAPLLDGGRIC
jgi:hypothetical protein